MNGVVLPYAGDSGTRSFTRYDIRTFRTVYIFVKGSGVVDIIWVGFYYYW
jgi:hypothetical protein